MLVPACMFLECLLYVEKGNAVTVCIPVHKAVTAYRNVREYKRPQRDVRLYRSRSTDTDYVQRAMLRLHFTSFKVYVCECIKLVHHDVDVVGSDSGRESRHSHTFIFACH